MKLKFFCQKFPIFYSGISIEFINNILNKNKNISYLNLIGTDHFTEDDCKKYYLPSYYCIKDYDKLIDTLLDYNVNILLIPGDKLININIIKLLTHNKYIIKTNLYNYLKSN